MCNPDRWLERLADEYEMAEREEDRKRIIDQMAAETDRQYDELRDREMEVPRDE